MLLRGQCLRRVLNLLDTPGHADFSEDTYRTLTAVDSALMVIDAAKGVEERTIKLMDVCRLRDTQISSSFAIAFSLIGALDADLMEIVGLSIRVSLFAVGLSLLIGLPAGAAIAIIPPGQHLR